MQIRDRMINEFELVEGENDREITELMETENHSVNYVYSGDKKKHLMGINKNQTEMFLSFIAISYGCFNIDNILFKQPIGNRYFSGLFSQIKYNFEIFTIFNPIFVPDKNNFINSIMEVERKILEKYDVNKKKNYFFNNYVNRKDFLGSKNMVIKFSGVWENKVSIGLIAKIIYMV